MQGYGFGERAYRASMGRGRLTPFEISREQTDLWLGIDPQTAGSLDPLAFERTVVEAIDFTRVTILEYEKTHPGFIAAMTPVSSDPSAPQLIGQLIEAGERAGIGPMGAVAGTVARYVAQRIERSYGTQELIIENGGDIYVRINRPLTMAVYAGSSPLSQKIGVIIPSGYSSLGVCTSAGTVGPSISYGKADAVMIICEDIALADAYATAFGNRVVVKEDVDAVIESIREIPEILSALVIKDDRAGVAGEFEVTFFR